MMVRRASIGSFFLKMIQFYAQHDEVVVGFCTVAVLFDGGLEDFDHLAGGLVLILCNDVDDAFITKLLMGWVHGFVQTVGVKEEFLAADIVDALALEGEFVEETQWTVIVLEFEEAVIEHRWVVAAVAEFEQTGVEIDDAEEHGDEHHGVVAFAQAAIHAGGQLFGLQSLAGQGAEQAGGLRHEERGGNALAADISQSEVEARVVKEEIVEVAADFLGRSHGCEEVDVLAFWERWKHAGHHGHLDVAGDAQLRLDAFLGGLHLSHTFGVTNTVQRVNDEESRQQDYCQQHAPKSLLRQLDLLLGDLGIFLVRLVDRGQFGSIAVLLLRDG